MVWMVIEAHRCTRTDLFSSEQPKQLPEFAHVRRKRYVSVKNYHLQAHNNSNKYYVIIK